MASAESPEARLPNDGSARQPAAGRRDTGRQPPSETSVVEYLGVLQKRRVAAILSFLAVVVPAAVIILLQPSVYEASARLMIDPAASSPVSFKDGGRTDTPAPAFFETQYETLLNRAVAQKVIENLKLWDSRAFMASDEVVNVRAFARWIYDQTAGRSRPGTAPAASAGDRASGLIDALLGRLSIRPIENSRLVDVVVASRDPKLAAVIANTFAQLSVDHDLESRFQSNQHASEWLEKRLAEQRAAVDSSEAALQRYREAHGSAPLDERQNIVVQRLADLSSSLTRARTERISKEGLYNQLVALQTSHASLDTFPLIQSNAYVQQLKAQVASLQKEQGQLAERYGDRYPDMVRVKSALQSAEAQLQAEIAKSVEAVRNDYLAARAQEQSLAGALEGQKRQTLDQQRVEIEFGSLQRDVTSNRQVLDSLLQQAKETGIEAAVQASNMRIVERAVVPAVPARPQRARSFLLALLGASLLSLGLVFALEFLDTRVKTPEEMRSYLAVPFLGMIPVVDQKDLDHSSPLVGKHSSADFSEAFRRARTSLMLSAVREHAKTIAVTSTNPREGKTVVACNLAAVLAQAGRRVLLIDADMRRPQAHEVFEIPQEPGLSDVLVGRAAVDQIIHREVAPGLAILAAGSIPSNPAELLARPALRHLLDSVGAQYDHVIVDCPPVMAVTDASLVANEVSGVVFVVGADTTPRAAARIALGDLRESRDNVLGAILNRVDLRGNRYYYSRYYRADYEKYYRRE